MTAAGSELWVVCSGKAEGYSSDDGIDFSPRSDPRRSMHWALPDSKQQTVTVHIPTKLP